MQHYLRGGFRLSREQLERRILNPPPGGLAGWLPATRVTCTFLASLHDTPFPGTQRNAGRHRRQPPPAGRPPAFQPFYLPIDREQTLPAPPAPHAGGRPRAPPGR